MPIRSASEEGAPKGVKEVPPLSENPKEWETIGEFISANYRREWTTAVKQVAMKKGKVDVDDYMMRNFTSGWERDAAGAVKKDAPEKEKWDYVTIILARRNALAATGSGSDEGGQDLRKMRAQRMGGEDNTDLPKKI
ncbi:MAG: hypothetical protein V1744_00005, partial [Candidatus Altiarchaeota archaeon]